MAEAKSVGNERTGPPARRLFDRSLAWFTVALLVVMLGLLVGPRVPDDAQATYCVVNVHLPGPFGISLNCDSPEFMRLAVNPAGLLEPQNTRQSRPGMIFAAAPLTWVLSPLAGLADILGAHAQRPDIVPSRIDAAFAQNVPAYLAYVILNVLTLLALFYCLHLICAPWTSGSVSALVIVAASGVLLVANDVTKVFVWTPHNQMCNLLVPVFTLAVCIRANAGALVRPAFAAGVGIIAGLGAAAYPLFVVVVPCIAICAAVFAWRDGSRKVWLASAVNLAVLALLIALPEALWVAFVILKTGALYHHETVVDHEVIWMLDDWQAGLSVLVDDWLDKFGQLLRFAAQQSAPVVALLIVVAGFAMTRRNDNSPRLSHRPSQWPLLATGMLVSGMCALFYTSVGLIVSRLAYSFIPALIAAAGGTALTVTTGDPARRRLMAYCCAAIAVAAALYTIIEDMPRP